MALLDVAHVSCSGGSFKFHLHKEARVQLWQQEMWWLLKITGGTAHTTSIISFSPYLECPIFMTSGRMAFNL